MAQETLVYDFVNKPSLEAVKGPTLSITRATTATVMGSDGYLKQVASGEARFTGARRRENLCIRSEALASQIVTRSGIADSSTTLSGFDNSIDFDNVGQTVSVYGYNWGGTPTQVAGKHYVLSAYVEVDDGSQPVLGHNSGTGDLSFVAGAALMTANYTYTQVSSTVWRVSATGTVSASGNCGVIKYLTQSAKVAKVSGLQLELVPTSITTPSAYIKTTGAAVSKVDYAPNIASHVSRDGLLVEEARTNICLQSEDFSTTWTIDRASVSANAAVAPDGSLTADELIEDATASNTHRAYQNVTGTAASYTFSVFMKANTRTWAYLRFTDSGSLPRHAWFDLGNGAVGTTEAGVTASIEDYGNGWYRCIATIGTSQTGATPILIGIATADNVSSYNGDGASSIYIWGAHDELGAFPTSYIPTTTASVTRNADAVSTTDVGWYYSAASTVYAKATPGYVGGSTAFYSIDDNTTNNRMQMYSGTTATFLIAQGGTLSVNTSEGTITAGASVRVASAVSANDFQAYVDGSADAPDTTVTMPTGITRLNVGSRGPTGSLPLNGHIAELAYWPERLSNSELSELSNGTIPITVGNGMNTMTNGQWWWRRRKLKRRLQNM